MPDPKILINIDRIDGNINILICLVFVIYYLFNPPQKKKKINLMIKTIGEVGFNLFSSLFHRKFNFTITSFTSSPSFTTSVTLATLLSASSEI